MFSTSEFSRRQAAVAAVTCGFMALPELVAVLPFLAPQTSFAQQPTSSRVEELEKKLDDSLKLIERLGRRIDELEAKVTPASPRAQSTAPAAAAAAPKPEERLLAIERKVEDISVAQSKSSIDFGLPLHGFLDVGYSKAGLGAGPDRSNGFALGTLDFYLTPQIGRVRSLIELVFEHDTTKGLSNDLERLQVGYAFSDAATLWLGRFHTPYGFWNTAFHHGAQLQTSILRPRFVDFEDKGGILPSHGVGLWLTGLRPAQGGKWTYDLYLANGSRSVEGKLDPNVGRDDNSNQAVGFRTGYEFGGKLRGLQIGLHGLTEEVDAYGADNALLNRARLNMLGAFASYQGDPWEVISEYYAFRNKDLGAGTGRRASWAGFVQAGRSFGDWTPYLRLEKTSLDQADPYFRSQQSGRSYNRAALGIRYDLSPQAALKMEINRTRQPQVPDGDYNQASLQYSIRF